MRKTSLFLSVFFQWWLWYYFGYLFSPSDDQVNKLCGSHMGDLINEQPEEFKFNVSFSIKEVFKYSKHQNTEILKDNLEV